MTEAMLGVLRLAAEGDDIDDDDLPPSPSVVEGVSSAETAPLDDSCCFCSARLRAATWASSSAMRSRGRRRLSARMHSRPACRQRSHDFASCGLGWQRTLSWLQPLQARLAIVAISSFLCLCICLCLCLSLCLSFPVFLLSVFWTVENPRHPRQCRRLTGQVRQSSPAAEHKKLLLLNQDRWTRRR